MGAPVKRLWREFWAAGGRTQEKTPEGGRYAYSDGTVQALEAVEGVEGVRVPAGRFNAYRLRVAFTTERGGADVKLLYLVPGLGVVAFRAGEGLVGLVRFSAP